MAENQIDDWKNRIDSDVRKLSERMAGVETGMSGLTSSFDRFSIAFNESVARQRDMHRPQWQVIFGALTLIAIVLGGFVSGYVRDLNRIEYNVENIRSNRMSSADPVQDEAINDIQQEIISIRSNEHTNFDRDATNSTQLGVLMDYKESFIEHIKDGHPRRIEGLLDLRMDIFENYKDDIRMEITRELNLRNEIRDNIHQRLDRIEHGWVSEHMHVGGD